MDIALISGELVLAGAALLLLLGARWLSGGACSIVALSAASAALLFSCGTVFGAGQAGFNGMVVQDGYARFFHLIFLMNLALTVCVSVRHVAEDVPRPEYYALLLLATAGMMFIASAMDLTVLYLGLELMALSVYVLVGIDRSDPRANEAAVKYFLLGGFSSAFLLYGASLTYGLSGSTGLAAIADSLGRGAHGGGRMLFAAVGLLAVGVGFKIAAAPFHAWAPDAYEGAPAPVTAFMAVGAKAAGFAALGRLCLGAFDAMSVQWSLVLAPLALLSIVVGNVAAIAQTNVKRMLAYSSIAHAGYALLGVVAGGADGMSSTMTYVFIYAFMTMGAFAVLILLGEEGSPGERLSDYEGLAKTSPCAAALMLLFMFSLTGIPPTAGFVAKFNVFLSLVRAGHAPLAIVAVAFSVVSAFFYLRVVMLMYMRDPSREIPVRPSAPLSAALAVAALAILAIGVFPHPLMVLASLP